MSSPVFNLSLSVPAPIAPPARRSIRPPEGVEMRACEASPYPNTRNTPLYSPLYTLRSTQLLHLHEHFFFMHLADAFIQSYIQ